MRHKCVIKDSCMHRKWEVHKCWTSAGRLAAPYQSAAFVCFFRMSIVIASSCSTQFFPLELSTSNLFMTVGSSTNSFASNSMCTSLPMINSFKRRLPRSLLCVAGDSSLHSSLHSSLFYCSYRSNFFPSLSFFRQVMLPGAVLAIKQRLCFI